jgi:hypothetical protein
VFQLPAPCNPCVRKLHSSALQTHHKCRKTNECGVFEDAGVFFLTAACLIQEVSKLQVKEADGTIPDNKEVPSRNSLRVQYFKQAESTTVK